MKGISTCCYLFITFFDCRLLSMKDVSYAHSTWFAGGFLSKVMTGFGSGIS